MIFLIIAAVDFIIGLNLFAYLSDQVRLYFYRVNYNNPMFYSPVMSQFQRTLALERYACASYLLRRGLSTNSSMRPPGPSGSGLSGDGSKQI